MSMICWMLAVSSTQISALRTSPGLVRDVAIVAQADESTTLLADGRSRMPPEPRAAAEARERELREQLKDYYAHVEEARTRIASLTPFRHALDLEKSWHILHYLLTGHFDTASAPGDTLLTGEELGEDVAGYGPARLHTSTDTQSFAKFLGTVDVATLRHRVNYNELSRLQIYGLPDGRASVAEFEDDLREEIAVYFPRLKQYVSQTAMAQDGLLVWLS